MTRARDLADQADGIIVGDLNVDGGTIKLDGNYPVGTYNVALGDAALSNGSLSGGNNTAVGYNSGANIAGGAGNTLTGSGAGVGITTGTNNSYFGVGTAAFDYNTGTANVGLGYQALYKITTASNNTAVGYQAGYNSATGAANTLIGYKAGDSMVSAVSNVAVGYNAYGLGTGSNNTCIGTSSGELITTGQNNTVLGRYNGNFGGLDIRTSSNYIVLSDGNGNYSAYGTAGAWYKANNTTTWSTVSDRRIKQNIVPLEGALDKIIALNPVEFDYILNGKHDVSFIAQEYQTVFPEQVREESAIGDEIKALTDGEPLLTLDTNLVPYLVKAIQELSAKNDALEARLAALES